MPELELPSRGFRMHYVEVGEGPIMLLLHSLGFDHSIFNRQISYFSQRGYRVLAPDLRGHGGSDAPEADCTLDDLTTDITVLLETLNIGQLALLGGLSMGGMVTLRLILNQPGLATRLALMGTSADIEHNATNYDQYVAALNNLRNLPDANRTVASKQLATYLVQHCFSKAHLQTVGTTDQWVDVVERFYTTQPGKIAAAVVYRDPVQDRLSEIHVPTLVLVGEYDEPLPLPNAEQLQQGITSATLHVLPDAGHLITVEQPDLVNRHLEALLS